MPAKTTLTKEQLTEAARMRNEDGATWNDIRAKFGVKLGSSAWFRAFEREGIAYRAAGEPKPQASEPAKPQATKPKAVEATKPKAVKATNAAPVAKATKAAPAKVTRKPRVAEPKATAAAEVAASA